MHTIEYVIVVIYMILLFGLGAVFQRLNKSGTDYFRSGSRGTWWLVGASIFVAGVSSRTFTANAGVAYDVGWTALFIYIPLVLAYLLHALFLAPMFRQLRATTFPEVVRWRFGPGTQQFYAYVKSLFYALVAATQLWAMAIFTSSMFGLNIYLVIIIAGITVLFYATTGGSWAVMATDFIQCMIVLPITLLIFVLCLKAIGGFSGFSEAVAAQGLTETFSLVKSPDAFPQAKYSWKWMLALGGWTLLVNSSIYGAQRYFAVKDSKAARKAALLAMFSVLVGAFAWMFPAMVARLLYADTVMDANISKAGEGAYAILSMELLPPGLAGLMLVAMIAATMSSMDTGLNKNAAQVVRDILPPLWIRFGSEPLSEKQQVLAGRITTLVMGALGISLALYFASREALGMFELLLKIGALVGLPMAIPMLLGLFVRQTPPWSAIFSAACGFVVSLTAFISGTVLDAPWSYQSKVGWVVGISTLGFMATKLFYGSVPESKKQNIEAFFRNMHTPVDFEAEVGDGNDPQQIRYVGAFTLAIGVAVSLLFIFQRSLFGVLCVAFVAGTIILIGGGMFIGGGRALRKEKQRKAEENTAVAED